MQRERQAGEWDQRRAALGLVSDTGWRVEPLDRAHVARLLGLSLRTLQRYEFGKAPAWYGHALRGLALDWKEKQAAAVKGKAKASK